MNKLKTLFFFMLAILAVSCENYDRTADSISTGKLKIGIDESYSLMMDSQIEVFEHIYKYAKVSATYTTEGEVFDLLLADSIQGAVVNRALTEKELEFFHSKGRYPESVKIATDAIAFIINPTNADSNLTVTQVTDIFSGKINSWKGINPASKLSKMSIVFDNNKSCNERYVREQIVKNGGLPSNCFAAKSNEAVVDYVSTHEGAMGIISVSWVSDRDDSTTKAIMDKVKLVGIIDPANTRRPEMARKPYQAYIYDESYPYRREVFYIRTGLKGTLGTGFVSHLAGEKGQLIIHKMGMVTATPPTRVIRITE
jgi:phosphate transport system substrate-binding protein